MTQRCATCSAPLSYLVGDVTPYELIDPLEGGPLALLPHSEERCRFHRFLTPRLSTVLLERWVRTDVPTG
jgi:hypothetical protein